jgi:hypothetical protein
MPALGVAAMMRRMLMVVTMGMVLTGLAWGQDAPPPQQTTKPAPTTDDAGPQQDT